MILEAEDAVSGEKTNLDLDELYISTKGPLKITINRVQSQNGVRLRRSATLPNFALLQAPGSR